jgi:hypothetical protein
LVVGDLQAGDPGSIPRDLMVRMTRAGDEGRWLRSHHPHVLPVFGIPRIGGVPLLGPKGTAKLLRKATGSLDENTLAALHYHLAQALPTA